ncbi:2Fe-2S iron-sulfur cluster binding domain-containing protein [Flaviaesturariibacter flavus]|uniref:2Fe-2S iron-sulfur cluster binding domain-containing protein n=1 Tax=Flaviaesturariibacter flavus TaxID=2502780 RepID=A0A4R1BPX1_9BACT|nr:FAD binding domain-containing protein [Flaviaesturariibacter flavus]TCJ19621.1 2Fe-2S iron-sulfur cluster binding domain-containing protein [Flaviaesturariibacter flavus]
MIRFLLNDSEVQTDLAAGSTLLDFVRYHKRLTGTKIGCREGDCGACTVLVGDFEDGRLTYRSATSCLMPLGNASGKHIVTVEGLNMNALSPVQQAMVNANGTQCGFCTLGFVLSFTGFVLHPQARAYEEAIASVDGNICRCTGYKSIERAAQIITDAVQEKPATGTTDWLVSNGFLPHYFSTIDERLQALKPADPDTAMSTDTLTIGGGTDLVVQRPHAVKVSALRLVSDQAELRGIVLRDGRLHLGGAVTVSQLLESPIVRKAFPHLPEYIKLVSSTPIRNMATVGGNLVNASPIGDLTIFLLALDAELTLSGPSGERTVLLRNFYKGYKQLDKAPGELVRSVSFKVPAENDYYNFEKVSKRTWLDIASVNSACQMRLDPDGTITSIHLSAGGVGPTPKYLAATVAYLTGKRWEPEVFDEALRVVNEEISPISDARGTAEYKRLLLRQLLAAHLQRAGLAPLILQNLLPA